MKKRLLKKLRKREMDIDTDIVAAVAVTTAAEWEERFGLPDSQQELAIVLGHAIYQYKELRKKVDK